MRSIKKTIELHGANELTATERAISNSAEILEVFSASPKNNFGQGHKVEHWASAIAGLVEMGLPEVADIARETLRIKSMQAELEAGDGPDQDRTTELLLLQTRRFIQIEKTTDFAELHRQFVDRSYQWA
jgi:hypothetical protein